MNYYLEDPARLESQPKRAIADYAEQKGILVPRRFSSLKEAKASGLPIIARSEHIQDYNGVSGLLRSPTTEKLANIESEEELKEKILAEPKNGTSQHRQYCLILNLDEKKFKEEVSFSYWELLKGYERVIIADSAIPRRYHIMTSESYQEEKPLCNYALVEDGRIIKEFITPLPDELKAGLENLIGLYESVRTLSRFDSNHCPIIEAHTFIGKNYFLQYHRARDFEPAQFTLERALQEGEVEVPFVRGVTAPEGMDCKVTVYYAWQYAWGNGRDERNEMILESKKEEEGSFDLHYKKAFSELRVRKRKTQIITMKRDLEWELLKFVIKHNDRSKLFKPQVSLILKADKIVNDEIIRKCADLTMRTGKNSYLNFHITSDGRRAFIRRI